MSQKLAQVGRAYRPEQSGSIPNKLAKPTVETYAKYAEYFGMPLRQLGGNGHGRGEQARFSRVDTLAKDEETLVLTVS